MDYLYQLYSTGKYNYDRATQRAQIAGFEPIEVIKDTVFMIPFTEETFGHDQFLSGLEIKYVLFTQSEYERIVENSDAIGLTIKGMMTRAFQFLDTIFNKTDGNMYVCCFSNEKFIDMLKRDEFIIKRLDLQFDNTKFEIYDCGAVKCSVEPADSAELVAKIKDIVEQYVDYNS